MQYEQRTSSSELSSTEPSLDTSPTKNPRAAANARSVHAAIVQNKLEQEPKKESQMKKTSLWERIQSSTYLLESTSPDSDSDLADLLGSSKKPTASKPRKLCMEPSNPPATTLLPKSQPSTKADPEIVEIVEIIDESSEEEDNDDRDTSASDKSLTKQLHHKSSKTRPTLAVKNTSLNEPVVLDDSFESLLSYCSESRETTSAMEI
jgi:hypothetical protein